MFFFINYSVQPIYRLIRRMSKTKDGQLDLTSKIEESGSYEIKELSHVYNILLDDINRYINQLVEEQSNRRKATVAKQKFTHCKCKSIRISSITH